MKDAGSRLADKYPDLKSALSGRAFKELLDAARSAPALDLASLEFRPVIPNPTKIFCIGHNYEEHRLETGRPKTGSPSVFIRFADSQVAHGQAVILPSSSTEFDFEGELAVIIGRGGRYIKKARRARSCGRLLLLQRHFCTRLAEAHLPIHAGQELPQAQGRSVPGWSPPMRYPIRRS